MPAHGFAEPETPPPSGALGVVPGTPPVTPTSTPPRFSLEAPSPSTASSRLPSTGGSGPSCADVEVPPMPDVASAMWTDVLGAELTCCGKKLGLQKAKRVLSIVSATAVILAAIVLLVTAVAVREADEVDQASAGRSPLLTASGDPCAPNPCMNGGKCQASALDPSTHVCSCRPGFVGNECEIDFDTCRSSPCLNHATCVDGADEYHCSCEAGFVGNACEVDILDQQLALCAQHGPCQNGQRLSWLRVFRRFQRGTL